MRILTFDIGGTLIKSGIFDEDFGLLDTCEHEYPEAGVAGILQVLKRESMGKEYQAIGISTAGLVDEQKGEITFCSDAIKGYSGTKLREIMENYTGKPTYIINDVNAAALGEAHYGNGKDFSDFICLTYGTGIGGAIVINKEVYQGINGFAGEIGHVVTHLGGKDCVCGGKGCYNEYSSVTALLKKCQEVDGNITNGFDVFSNFKNVKIREILDAWIDEIVHGLAIVTHIFNPGLILLGGGIMNEKYIIAQVEQKLRSAVMIGYKDVIVAPNALGNWAGLMGSSANALRKIKNDL